MTGVKIEYLAEHWDFIPLIARWFHSEWACFYPGKDLAGFEVMVAERASRDKLPLALVALDGGELLGIGCLKPSDMETRPELTPWLAGMYVAEGKRGRGIGAALVRAVEDKARRMGIKKLYLHTPDAEKFYSALGWGLRERTSYCGREVSVMEKDLA